MSENEFLQLVDHTLDQFEDALVAADLDPDFSREGHVLTVEFENGQSMVLNAQAPFRELWLASRQGAYHFKWIDGQWIDNRSEGNLKAMLARDVSALTGTGVILKWA
jgi:CyaY protein